MSIHLSGTVRWIRADYAGDVAAINLFNHRILQEPWVPVYQYTPWLCGIDDLPDYLAFQQAEIAYEAWCESIYTNQLFR